MPEIKSVPGDWEDIDEQPSDCGSWTADAAPTGCDSFTSPTLTEDCDEWIPPVLGITARVILIGDNRMVHSLNGEAIILGGE